jgi:hypothetical protein
MKNGSYFIPREQIHTFMNPGAMNNEEGLYIYWETDPAAARRVLPPQLDLIDLGTRQLAEKFKRDYIDKGWLGVKSGRGFYTYPDPAYLRPEFLGGDSE